MQREVSLRHSSLSVDDPHVPLRCCTIETDLFHNSISAEIDVIWSSSKNVH